MTPTIRDEATALLAEALATTCSDPWECLHGTERDHDAASILAASPTLAADLEFAIAWRRVVRALLEGWVLVELRMHDDRSGWGAEAFNETRVGRYRQMGYGPTPTAALETLAEMLEATR